MLATGEVARWSSAGATENGFTLIEMLIVLGIAGLIAGLGYPRLQAMTRGAEYRAAVVTAVTLLREARARALRTDTPQRLTVATDGAAIGFGDTVADAPASVRLALEPDTGILFHADGSSTGGELTIAGADRTSRFVVQPATGLAAPA